MAILPRPPAGEQGENRYIVVGVDYGTTWSGIAWGQSARVSISSVTADTFRADLKQA
jgi:molecular chaperone DnaK (HSP70)